MYEYVTMKETSNFGDYNSKTCYRHHVLKPVYDIFDPNIEMEALSANATGEDNIFWAKVTENYGGLNGANARNVEAKKIEVNINSALIGQIKSIENLNREGQVMLKTVNEYINGTKLASQEPNKGYTKETFNSMKTVFTTDISGTIINDAKRLLSISSKTEYNNMLKKTTSIAGGLKSSIEYSDVDPWLSSFRKSETTMADGTKKMDIRIPAYEKYPNMQSKVLDPANKNMLTQEAMNISNIEVSDNLWKTISANVITWNGSWNDIDKNAQINSRSDLWRKHQNFVWRGDLDTNGTYGQLLNVNSFNWGIGATQANTEWQKVFEITKHTLWSLPVEAMDINGNYASSKMADNFNKTIAGGNARYHDMYFSGAEYVDNGNMFEGEVLGANYRTYEEAHTGSWSVKSPGSTEKVFEINKPVSTNVNGNSIRPGNYKVSFWVMENLSDISTDAVLKVNGVVIPSSESVQAGCWAQHNYYVNIPEIANNFNLNVTSPGFMRYFDDFRMHPVASSMNSYVYNQSTDELIAILGSNNLASVFCYDAAGRLCTTYTEVADQGINAGGFKIIGKNKYNYLGIQTNYAGCDCIVSYCNDSDIDEDGISNAFDNCPNDYNPDQSDQNNNGIGDICEPDYGDIIDARNDEYAPIIGDDIICNILVNDIIDNTLTLLEIVTQPTNGAIATIDNKGTASLLDDVIIVTNASWFNNSFIYKITDDKGKSDTAVVQYYIIQ